jgi:hypothetical protein
MLPICTRNGRESLHNMLGAWPRKFNLCAAAKLSQLYPAPDENLAVHNLLLSIKVQVAQGYLRARVALA